MTIAILVFLRLAGRIPFALIRHSPVAPRKNPHCELTSFDLTPGDHARRKLPNWLRRSRPGLKSQ